MFQSRESHAKQPILGRFFAKVIDFIGFFMRFLPFMIYIGIRIFLCL